MDRPSSTTPAGNVAGRGTGMHASTMQGLVGVDVANTCQEALVDQGGLDGPADRGE